ncbi:MAG TPA: hypothetical protein VM142_05815 [Acidimicrobiales bacterium]|nr:hypothetical protein [Acidimicrobiales bacterium]
MGTEVRVEHAYPAAMDFLRRHGPETLAVLHEIESDSHPKTP